MFSLVFNHLFFVFDFFVSLGFVLSCTVVGGCNVHVDEEELVFFFFGFGRIFLLAGLSFQEFFFSHFH